MPSSHLILCHPLLPLPSIFPSITVFSNESALLIRWPKYCSFSFSISSSNERPGLISFRMDWLDILAVPGTIKSLAHHWYLNKASPGGSDGKASTRNAGGPGLIPGWGRSPEEGHGNPLQHSCLENPMDRAAWRAAAHRAAESDITEQLSARTHTHTGRQECLFGCRRDAIVAVLLAAAEGRFSCVRRPRNTAVVLHCWHEGGSPVQLIPEAMWPDQLRTKEGLQFS